MNWEETKNLASSSFAKYTILIPVVGWLVVYNGEFQSFLAQALDVQQAEDATVGWRIMVFYLGLVLIGISSAIFQLRCPPEIKFHDGLGGFINDTVAHLTDQKFTSLCQSYGVEKPCAKGPSNNGFALNEYILREQWVKFQAEDIYDILSARYEFQLTVRNWSRCLTVSLFFLGVVITLIPTATTLWWIVVEIKAQIIS